VTRLSLAAALALPALTLLGSCSSLSMPSFNFGGKDSNNNLVHVDDLLSRIELVHVETELAKQRTQEAVDALLVISSPEFDGDPIVAFNAYTATLDQSEGQAKKLRAAVDPMKKAGDQYFKQWLADVETIVNAQLRSAALERMQETRQRYDALCAAVDPAQAELAAFNLNLRDVATFLGNDLNMASVAAIERNVKVVDMRSNKLSQRFDAVMAACQDYVAASALPGQVSERSSKASSSEPKRATNPFATGR